MLAGISAAVYAFWQWKEHAFGAMVAERIARIVIPSSVAISLGLEVILFSFLLSVFTLSVRPYLAMVEEIEQSRFREPAYPKGTVTPKGAVTPAATMSRDLLRLETLTPHSGPPPNVEF
jgi:hypothetical protein